MKKICVPGLILLACADMESYTFYCKIGEPIIEDLCGVDIPGRAPSRYEEGKYPELDLEYTYKYVANTPITCTFDKYDEELDIPYTEQCSCIGQTADFWIRWKNLRIRASQILGDCKYEWDMRIENKED